MKRLKSIIRLMFLPFGRVAGSALIVLMALAGLRSLAPLDHELPTLEFGLCFFLDVIFWLGWVALTLSFDFWIISILSAGKRPRKLPELATGRLPGGAEIKQLFMPVH